MSLGFSSCSLRCSPPPCPKPNSPSPPAFKFSSSSQSYLYPSRHPCYPRTLPRPKKALHPSGLRFPIITSTRASIGNPKPTMTSQSESNATTEPTQSTPPDPNVWVCITKIGTPALDPHRTCPRFLTTLGQDYLVDGFEAS